MAYLLHYKIRVERNDGAEANPNIVESLQESAVFATDSNYDEQMAFAKSEAYDGEVTVEEVSDSDNSTVEQRLAEIDQVLDALLGGEG